MSAATPHLDAVTWERLAIGELDGAARAQALDHVIGCARCGAIYKGVLALQAGAREEGLVRQPAPRRRWLGAGLAALSACAALVALWPAPRPRLDQPSGVRSGGEVSTVTLAPAANDARPTLSWSAVAGATRYRVAVFTEEGLPCWTREVDGPSLAWPADAPPPAGGRWRVEALRGTAVVARSPLQPLRASP